MKHYFSVLLLFAALIFLAPGARAQETINPKPFGMWMREFKQEATAQGISNAVLDEAFANTAPLPRVIALDRKQPESQLSFAEYLHKIVDDARVRQGQKLYDENEALLEEISERYQVQPEYLLALWGIETGYGANTGGFNILDALATLAYDGRRSGYFRTELLKALQIVQEDGIAPARMKGSWAGAMGQCQFMPSSFLDYAVDYTQSGKRDIWSNRADVLASIANYLHSSGWNGQVGWGIKVALPEGFDLKLADIKSFKSVAEWQTLGVRKLGGAALPDDAAPMALALVGSGEEAVPYLITGNYNVLLKWNRSRYFATSVGTLADKIAQ